MTTPEPAPINPNLKPTTTTTYTCPQCKEHLTINPPTQQQLNLIYRSHLDYHFPDNPNIAKNINYTPHNQNENPQTIKAIITDIPNPNTTPETARIAYIHPDGGIIDTTATQAPQDTKTPIEGTYTYQ
jgi:hypothetical protein